MQADPSGDRDRIRVLLVEDDEDDYILTKDMLDNDSDLKFELQWISDFETAAAEITEDRHDVCLVDYRLGANNGLELLKVAREAGCSVPIIMLTGQKDRETDMAAMRHGAADYLVKSQIAGPLLTRSIRYAMDRKRTEQNLRDLAHYDDLTGLASRAMFQELAQGALARARRSGNSAALLYIDLDNFKTVNDTLGHQIGDELLVGVAGRIKHCLRETDTLARLGGDEFAVVLEGLARDKDAASVAQKILDRLAPEFELHGHKVYTGASIGIVVYSDDDEGVEELTKKADMAMYRAKQQGRGTYEFHTDDMTVAARSRLAMETGLRDALQQEQFQLLYLPQMDLASGRITSVEALLRWEDPQTGTIYPERFIPVAEEIGLITRIGEWVLRSACEHNLMWQKEGLPPTRVSVNLSARQFHQDALTATVERILRETGLDPKLLDLELTEGHLAENAEKGLATLTALKSLGVSISIDDFGTGYSSLGHLKDFPVDALKIDLSFVRGIPHDRKDCAVAATVINLARSFELAAIAEGVETQEQLDWLARNGCNSVQGYLISRPLPADGVRAWIEEQTPILQAAVG